MRLLNSSVVFFPGEWCSPGLAAVAAQGLQQTALSGTTAADGSAVQMFNLTLAVKLRNSLPEAPGERSALGFAGVQGSGQTARHGLWRAASCVACNGPPSMAELLPATLAQGSSRRRQRDDPPPVLPGLAAQCLFAAGSGGSMNPCIGLQQAYMLHSTSHNSCSIGVPLSLQAQRAS